MAGRLILAGDVGATKTLLGLFRDEGENLISVRVHRYTSADHPSLEAVCADFAAGERIGAACLGVPGVVTGGAAEASNLAWKMNECAVASALGGAPVRLLNDLSAAAFGLVHLGEADYRVINRGAPHAPGGNLAAIAAGTGLGEAALIWDGRRYHAVASEGGHSSFAPQGDEQIELLKFLAREFGHVSWERVLSGPGLVNIYRFARANSAEREPAWLARALAAGDPAAAISEAAMAKRDAACAHALTMFCAMYGSEAGNLALKVLATGGVYLCGGIALRILPWLERGGFMRSFRDKGRLGAILARIEVRVVMRADTALVGAAHYAHAMLDQISDQ
jgi:glucokinase